MPTVNGTITVEIVGKDIADLAKELNAKDGGKGKGGTNIMAALGGKDKGASSDMKTESSPEDETTSTHEFSNHGLMR